MVRFVPYREVKENLHSYLFTMAKDLAPVRRFRIAAAVVNSRNKQIISLGHAHYKTHPFQARFSANVHSNFWHAETHAIHNALRALNTDRLEGYSLHVIRAKRTTDHHWHLGCVKPCEGCTDCIKYFKLDAVFYSDE